MTEHRSGKWKRQKFKGVSKDDFRTTNEWATALLKWETRVRAMCLIVQAKLDISDAAFAAVVDAVENNRHSPAEIKKIFKDEEEAAKRPGAAVHVATDVVGQPPDPPFDESGLK